MPKLIEEWKKAHIKDVAYVSTEVKDLIPLKSLILLEGDLGSGKTTFAKSFIDDSETFSPSYSIISETPTFLHADFYRLKNRDEIPLLELELYLEDKDYFLVEWGEQYLSVISRELPKDFSIFKLQIEHKTQGKNSTTQEYRNYQLFEFPQED